MAASQVFSLAGRAAFVTGAAQGLGKAIATGMTQAGARVVLADLDGRAQPVALALRDAGYDALAVDLDVRDEAMFKCVFESSAASCGGIDVVVNNAASTPSGSIWDIASSEWDDVMAVNLRGTFFGCRIAGLHMRDRGRGRIVNMASIAGQQASPATAAHYAASKGGIVALTRSFAQLMAPYGVTVNAISPAAIRGPALMSMDVEVRRDIENATPLRRFGEDHEVAAAAVYLASDAAAFTTGATLDINGGGG